MASVEENLQVQLKNVLVSMVSKMTSVVDGGVMKQIGALNYDLFELKLDFPSELESL
jgi:hypothetical protein